MAGDPAAGLAIVDAIADHPTMREYPHWASARADLLTRLGRADEARAAFERAAGLTRHARDREVLLARANQRS
jgi:predicted RNA polymerase sigma factor